MFASPTIQSAAVSFSCGQSTALEGPIMQVPRVGGLRRLGEILPLVLQRLEEHENFTSEPIRGSHEMVIAVRLGPFETPHFSAIEGTKASWIASCQADV